MPFDPDYDWERDFEREELRRKPRPFMCSDGYCGATDCARCYPGIDHNRKDEDEDPVIDLIN